jgi:hypothetical protein
VHRAGDDGVATLAAFGRSGPALPAGPLVLAPSPDHGGWIPFGYGTLGPAVRLRTGSDVEVRDPRYVLGRVDPDETVVAGSAGGIVVVAPPTG